MVRIGNKGQTLVEYVLIIGLISVIAVSLVTLLGGYLKDSITKSSCPLVGEQYVKGKKPGEGRCTETNPSTNSNEIG